MKDMYKDKENKINYIGKKNIPDSIEKQLLEMKAMGFNIQGVINKDDPEALKTGMEKEEPTVVEVMIDQYREELRQLRTKHGILLGRHKDVKKYALNLEDMNDKLQEEAIHQDDVIKAKDWQIVKERSKRRKNIESKQPAILVKKYSLTDHRYENIMSHMDILWCDSKGWDDCSKCTGYRDIIMSALDKIESMSSRRIDKDFSTKHKSGDPMYDIEDNTNAVTRLGGGDKNEDEYVKNCMLKRQYRS